MTAPELPRRLHTPVRSPRAARHTDGLWLALAQAVRDDEDDVHASRRRLAALRLHQAYASAGDYCCAG
jgi:hypothetical protein